MKAWIKSGALLTLGWLAQGASGQEVQWRAATSKNTSVTRAVAAAPASSDVRPVSIGQPLPLENGQTTGSFRPFAGVVMPTVRAQAGEDKSPMPIPTLEIGGDQKTPKPLPKSGGVFNPPPPQATPSPVFGNLGMTPENGCYNDCCASWCGVGANCCDDRPRFWTSVEYLMWWQRSQLVPPLVTSSPSSTNNPIGVLNSPDTQVLYNDTPDRTRGGGRFGVGWWSSRFCNLGFDSTFFFLGRQIATSTFGPGTGTFLARPYNEVLLNGTPNAEVFVGPGITGMTTITNYSQLWGVEANLRRKLHCGPGWWLDGVAGYRHVNLSEGIDITESLLFTQGKLAGTQFIENESFRTRNEFNGAQIGLAGECRLWRRWFIGGSTKVALGNVYQVIDINGNTTRVLPGGVTEIQQGALLATQTNIGRYTDNRFAVMPEVNLKIGYDVTDHLRVFVGYDFLYLSSVVRPGEQIDLNVNSNFRPFTGNANPAGLRLPAMPFRRSDFWAQGMSFGLQYTY
ncbi:MAG: BBP7 family outer membrane beta-barrel protein [Planctomycetes bacterium]|nr:BBP7 family outer membrane beta-barrel protein [Planctomycetota bacterium]